MQMIKRHLFAMRNGVIADTLRRGGSPFSIIFGVNLPQLTEIAATHGPDRELAEKLWANTTTRESMLLAPMLMPREDFSEDQAIRWAEQSPCPEVTDVLCLKLLRHQPYALDLVRKLADDPKPMSRYAALRLMCNLAPQNIEMAVEIGRRAQPEVAQYPQTRQPVEVLLSYADLD